MLTDLPLALTFRLIPVLYVAYGVSCYRGIFYLSVLFGIGLLFCYFSSGKIVSPKWKNFRGIKVKLKDKIRLNNIIWREWHRQCMPSACVYLRRNEFIFTQESQRNIVLCNLLTSQIIRVKLSWISGLQLKLYQT